MTIIENGTVECDTCSKRHPATYHHEGSHGEGAVYEVTCDVDGLADYYLTERVTAPPTVVPTASSISAALRRCGFAPNSDRNRQALRVRRSAVPGTVNVSVDLDTESASERLATDAADALRGLGYSVRRDGSYMSVTR